MHACVRRYEHVFTKPKWDYNALHPYTSWIPILIWIVVRPPEALKPASTALKP